MFLETDLIYRDYAYLKKLGNSYKLIKCNEVRRKGLESVELHIEKDTFYRKRGFRSALEIYETSKVYADFTSKDNITEKKKLSDEDVKLANNICRARNKLLEYVLCNDFVFFVTFTLDGKKYDRTDLNKFSKDWSDFVRNYNRRKNADIKYVLVPERHIDGCWHMHGFVMGLPYDRLELFNIYGDKPLPRYIVDGIKKGKLLYYFPEYEKRFGYNIFEPIRNKKASVLYMNKYLTKDISRNVTELGAHLYYCSKGLKKAEIIKEGQFLDSNYEFGFTNEYGSQTFFDFLDDKEVEEIKEKIGGTPVVLDDYKRGYRKNNDGFQEFMDPDTGEKIGNMPDVFEMFG